MFRHTDSLVVVHRLLIAVASLVAEHPGGPVVKNLPCNAGDMGSIPGQGTKIPPAATTEPV